MPLKPNSTVLITGGASGVGRAMGEAFDAAGATIWVVDVDQTALDTCPDQWGRACFDVTNENAIKTLFDSHLTDGIDVLCANAGIAGPTAAIEDIKLDDWRACTAVNLDSAFLFSKYAVPAMKSRGSGSIIITSSTAGLHGYPQRSPYASAKWAVIGLAKTLAMELGPHGIRANALCPGSVNGPRMDGVIAREAELKGREPEDIRTGYTAGTSMRTFVDAADIANMAVFLASDEGRYVTGQAISVDGHVFNPDP
ncbi:MAG: SDR family oxidoreductase [Paracoccaceae bacterium]